MTLAKIVDADIIDLNQRRRQLHSKDSTPITLPACCLVWVPIYIWFVA